MFKDNDSLFYIIPSYECNNRFYRKEVEKWKILKNLKMK
jgi:hypothetical protein